MVSFDKHLEREAEVARISSDITMLRVLLYRRSGDNPLRLSFERTDGERPLHQFHDTLSR
jgi:hypothetical protein